MAKKQKTFVDSKDTALQLAESIADKQEEKTTIKKRQGQERKQNQQKPRKKHNGDVSRIQKAKELILARKAQVKKEKAKAASSESLPIRAKKGVSFA